MPRMGSPEDIDSTLKDLSGVYTLCSRSRKNLERIFWLVSVLGFFSVFISLLKADSKVPLLSAMTALMVILSMSVTVGLRRYKEVEISGLGVRFLPNGPNIERRLIDRMTVARGASGARALRLKVKNYRFLYFVGSIHWVFDTVTFNIE